MAAKKTNSTDTGKAKAGYNEKNPTEPQGAFKADSMQTKASEQDKRTKGPGIKRQYSKK